MSSFQNEIHSVSKKIFVLQHIYFRNVASEQQLDIKLECEL